MLTGILAGIAAKLSGMGVAAKATVGLGIATAATAGVATVMPVVVPDAPGGTVPPVEIPVPGLPTPADAGLSVAADATSGQLNAGAQTGLDIAAQTPAGAKLPTVVAPLSSVPPVSAAATPSVQLPPAGSNGSTGLDRAAQTPAASHLPTLAGPPASVPPAGPPASLPPAAGAASTGIDTASNTPGGQFIPPFVKGMSGR